MGPIGPVGPLLEETFMSSSIAQNIEALCQEQGIDRDLVIEAMKEAVRAAAKKQFRSGEDIQVDWNAETGIALGFESRR